ncbi:MAG TPA: hypothetical protein VHV54_09400, partial [Candidatus Binatia bacterium]|nr:hypothetical protein [Candidatus Binatia bacterium]
MFRRDERPGKSIKRSVIGALLSSLLLGYATSWVWSAASDTPKPAPPTYVGNEVCQACHAPQFEKFSQTEMGKIFLYNARNET